MGGVLRVPRNELIGGQITSRLPVVQQEDLILRGRTLRPVFQRCNQDRFLLVRSESFVQEFRVQPGTQRTFIPRGVDPVQIVRSGVQRLVTDQQDSILAAIASVLAPLMKPVGLGDWRICTALISGFMAKESVVSTLGILFGKSVTTALSAASAASLLVFSLLYTPCVAAIASIRREMGPKWAFIVIIWQCFIAWLAALITYMIL